jgi:hypothetical protein
MIRMTRSILLGVLVALGGCDEKKSDAPTSAAAEGATKADPKADAKAEGGAAAAEGGAPEADARSLPAAEEILAKAVDAVGGTDKLAAIESFYYEGKIEILGQNIDGAVKIWWKKGDFYTEQEMKGIGTVRAGKAGDVVWAEDPITGLRELEGAEAEQHMWASSLQLAADWKRYFEKATTVGERTIDDAKVYDVTLVAATGGKVTMSFDATSGLQVAQQFQQVTPLGSLPVTVKMQDYRDVEGVKIAFQQVTDANLMKATQTITKIEINPEVSESRFAMPKTGAETVKKPPETKAEAHG